MRARTYTFFCSLLFLSCLLFSGNVTGQSISVAPIDCYPEYTTQAEMDAAAAAGNTNQPFATWRGAINYANDPANNIFTINFAPGLYCDDGSYAPLDANGSATGLAITRAGLTINGNGATLYNSNDCVSDAVNTVSAANIQAANVTIDGFTFIAFTGTSLGGAIYVGSSASNFLISNCNFDRCDLNGASAVLVEGGATGTFEGCDFYNHQFTTGSAMDILGAATDIDINNCNYYCNYRDNNGGRGGAIYLVSATVDFTGCVFSGNVAGGNAPGGAISVESDAVVSFTSSVFTCNTADVLTDQDGGALNIESGSSVTINGCHFEGNVAKRHGGAIRAAGASASLVTLDIDNTQFVGNSTNTALSKGGAIHLNDANTTLDESYFTGNSVNTGNGQGGGMFVDRGNAIATLTFNSNTFVSNTASGNCTGIDIFAEAHISGLNNDLEHLLDGHNLSEQAGSLQFDNGDDCDDLLNWPNQGGGDVVINSGTYLRLDESASTYASQQEGSFDPSQKVYWTINMYTPSTISNSKWMAFALSSDGPDLTTSNGYALALKRNSASSGSRLLQFIRFQNGLDDIYNTTDVTVLASLETLTTSSGSIAAKVVYDNGSWDFYTTNAGTASELDAEARGFNWCNTTANVSGEVINAGSNYVGAFYESNSGFSSNFGDFNNYYFRVGDETTGTGWSGAPASIPCIACPYAPPAPPMDVCTAQGSIQGVVFDDTADTNGIDDNGAPIAGVTVTLYDADTNMPIATVITGADGSYYFGGLADGNYYVEFTLPAGYMTATYQDNGGDGSNDSDINSTTLTSPILIIQTNTNAAVNSSSVESNDDNSVGYAHFENIDAGFSSTVLPIEIKSFHVLYEESVVHLDWTTVSEVNNDYFVLEHSTNGQDFKPFGMVDGEGNSMSELNYSYVHGSPSYGVNYYRFIQYDFDGKFSYSEIKSVNVSSKDKKRLSVSVFPNPSSGNLNIATNEELLVSKLIVVDITGRKVYESLNGELAYDLAQLRAGIYMIKITDDSGFEHPGVKWIKLD